MKEYLILINLQPCSESKNCWILIFEASKGVKNFNGYRIIKELQLNLNIIFFRLIQWQTFSVNYIIAGKIRFTA